MNIFHKLHISLAPPVPKKKGKETGRRFILSQQIRKFWAMGGVLLFNN